MSVLEDILREAYYNSSLGNLPIDLQVGCGLDFSNQTGAEALHTDTRASRPGNPQIIAGMAAAADFCKDTARFGIPNYWVVSQRSLVRQGPIEAAEFTRSTTCPYSQLIDKAQPKETDVVLGKTTHGLFEQRYRPQGIPYNPIDYLAFGQGKTTFLTCGVRASKCVPAAVTSAFKAAGERGIEIRMIVVEDATDQLSSDAGGIVQKILDQDPLQLIRSHQLFSTTRDEITSILEPLAA